MFAENLDLRRGAENLEDGGKGALWKGGGFEERNATEGGKLKHGLMKSLAGPAQPKLMGAEKNAEKAIDDVTSCRTNDFLRTNHNHEN